MNFHRLILRTWIYFFLLLLNTSMLGAQTVSEITYVDLPAEITPESINTQLQMPVGSEYNKATLNAERDRVTEALISLGFLDADTKTKVNYLPTGMRLTYTIKARNRYTIDKIEIPGMDEKALSEIVQTLNITKDTICSDIIYDELARACAPKIAVHYLFLKFTAKPNNDRKTATLLIWK